MFRQRLEHLLAEVIGDEPIGSAELGHERIRIMVVSKRHSSQLQPGGPSLCSIDEDGHAVGSEGAPGDAFE